MAQPVSAYAARAIRRLQHQPGAGVQRIAAVLDAGIWRRVCCRQPAVRIWLSILSHLDAVPASCPRKLTSKKACASACPPATPCIPRLVSSKHVVEGRALWPCKLVASGSACGREILAFQSLIDLLPRCAGLCRTRSEVVVPHAGKCVCTSVGCYNMLGTMCACLQRRRRVRHRMARGGQLRQQAERI